ncbi:metal ABC transporter substrate-binding protein [Elongatibacter sediminis]|uniref:Zinc ABC transporter substrate-binding protein n=1 Tax=Elongatibacter sediminis TaxID=3119006 RepID=A0AAW9R6N4_9GAMM
MIRASFMTFVLGAGIMLCGPVHAALSVFTCEPEWASLAEELGGKKVSARSATHGRQDPHYIQARPSLIASVRRADLVICTGAQLEIGWLPALLGKANNPDVLPGKDGMFEASSFVRKLEVPDRVDRSQGDVHVQGNPHIQMDPRNIRTVAVRLAERLSRVDPENADFYADRLQTFLARWDESVAGWEERAKALDGKRVVAHHKSFPYLEAWLGLNEVATLEPLPGIPPTSSHLAELLEMLGTDGSGADLIIHEAYQNPRPSEWLSGKTGIPAVLLPTTVGGSDEATDLFSLFDDMIDRLLRAVQ